MQAKFLWRARTAWSSGFRGRKDVADDPGVDADCRAASLLRFRCGTCRIARQSRFHRSARGASDPRKSGSVRYGRYSVPLKQSGACHVAAHGRAQRGSSTMAASIVATLGVCIAADQLGAIGTANAKLFHCPASHSRPSVNTSLSRPQNIDGLLAYSRRLDEGGVTPRQMTGRCLPTGRAIDLLGERSIRRRQVTHRRHDGIATRDQRRAGLRRMRRPPIMQTGRR
jgi:hypothetical protein